VSPSETASIALNTGDGWTIHLQAYNPPASLAPRAALLIGPAMMVNRRSLDRPTGKGMASFFAESGYVVYTLDVRGHGESQPAASRHVDWSYEQIIHIDLPTAIRAVKNRHPSLPLVLVGHSLCGHGGAASLGCAPELPVDLLVMLGANIWLPQLEPSLRYRLLKLATLLIWQAITDRKGYFPARALRIGSDDEARTYVGQFLRWMKSDRWGQEIDYLGQLEHITIPALQVNGRGDRLFCRTPCAKRFIEHFTGSDVDFWEISAADLQGGQGKEPDHMTIAVDPRSRPIWQRIDQWIDAKLKQI